MSPFRAHRRGVLTAYPAILARRWRSRLKIGGMLLEKAGDLDQYWRLPRTAGDDFRTTAQSRRKRSIE